MSSIKLSVRGSHVPSFKNSKVLVGGRNGKPPRTMTKPEFQEWMQKCEDAFVSQLNSLYRIEAGMPMARSPRSWIACVAPSNDSVNCITEITIKVHGVDAGQEGAELTIEPL